MRLTKTNNNKGAALETVRARLDQWRREHGGRGRRIPPELWDEAARVAEVVGPEETARALRLDERRLMATLDVLEPSFVEIEGMGQLPPSGASVVEIHNRYGDRMQVCIPPDASAALMQLVTALLEVRR
jgi:hypothetical protein